ncbi:hypothetical protein C2G38_2136806 [Gigaspora rosea]|uniref:Uncharacterized protein n=1 Tax=Gigaspora rosea TaxID=44941 RepID=A0A397WAC9_9GLOM|nr:hypothetical protein C2G38_2136806 [Gigaspora rosea]
MSEQDSHQASLVKKKEKERASIVYTSTARTGTETNAFLKVLERLLNFFVLQQGAMICHHCLYKTDDDPEYVNLPDYLLPPERISKKDIRKFQELVPLTGLNNKFINGVKAEVGYLLDASGASSSAIETLADAGLMVRREIIARHKAQHTKTQTMIVGNFLTDNTHEERVEHLLVHSYDNRIEQCREDRSMDNTKLVELKVGLLHLLEDYIDALQSLTNIGEARTYLENQILVAPMDYPGQLNVRRAVNHRIKRGDSSGIPRQVLHIVPMIGPLHVSLNSRESVFLFNYDFLINFFMLFMEVGRANRLQQTQNIVFHRSDIALMLRHCQWVGTLCILHELINTVIWRTVQGRMRLGSQCKYCKDYLISGIEKNCKAYDESVNSTEKATKVVDKGNSNVPETTETTTHTSAVEVDNVVLNSNIDQLYSNAMNNFRAAL